MTNSMNFARRALRGGTALQALALMGAGLAAVGVTAPATAQDYTNVNATGRVQGTNGEPIAGATVTVTSNSQGFSRTVTTSSDGTFRVASIPQGSYSFTITASGFESFTEPAATLTQSSSANQFTLAPEGASVEGEIVVTAGRVQVADFDRNTVGAVIPIGELATRVPVARDLTSVVLLAPGTSQGDSAFGNLPSVSGSSVSENAYYINGLNITEFRQGLTPVAVPFEFYNTIDIKNGSIPAEFGRFTGAFINATTKSGGNDFHGGMLFNYEPNELREDEPNTIGGNSVRNGFNQQDQRDITQANFYLSGPIIKDHLFFYGIYQSNNSRFADTLLTSNPNTTQLVQNANGTTSRVQVPPYSTGLRRTYDVNTSPFFGGKLDAVIVDGQRLEFTYFNTKSRRTLNSFNVVDRFGGGYDSRVDDIALPGSYQGTAVVRAGGENYVGRYTGQFTDWLTLSAAYGKNKNRSVQGSNADDVPFISDVSGQFNPALTGNPVQAILSDQDTRTFYRGDVDLFVNLLGEHHFRGGYDREELESVSQALRTGGVDYSYNFSGPGGDAYAPANTLYTGKTTYVNGGTFTSLNEAAYIQDSWSAFSNRVNITGGVRWDRFKADNVAGERYYDSGDTFAPRISASFDPIGDQRTKIYGFFGRYYLPVPTNTNIRLAGAELFFTEYFRTSGPGANNIPVLGAPLLFTGAGVCPSTGVRNCDVNDNGEPSPTAATVSTTLKPQSLDEYVLGYEQRFGDRWRVGAFGMYRKLNDSLEDVAIDAAVNSYCAANRIQGCEDIWSGFHQYVLVNPGSASTVTLSDPVNGETGLRVVNFSAADLGYPKAEREYKAVTLTLDREFDGVWSFSGSYTYAKNVGNIEGGIRSDNGQSDSGLTTAFDQPGLVNGAYGYLPTDVRHNIKAYGSYRVFQWLTLGVQTQASSPRSYGCIGRVPDAVDGFAGQYGAAGFYCNVRNGQILTNPATAVTQADLQLTPRGRSFKSDWLTFTNVSAAIKLPTDLFSATFRVDVFNLFKEKAAVDFEERGTQAGGNPRGDYAFPLVYQQPRYIRLQLGFDF